MQVKIKLGKDWWLLPSVQEFTQKELAAYSDVPYIAPLKAGERVRFLDLRKKKLVKQIISMIAMAHYQGLEPHLEDGTIIFK